MTAQLDELAALDFCYLTTTGRVSRMAHTIEIWFALDGRTLYMLAGAGENADWVKNARRKSAIFIRIGDEMFAGTARIVTVPDEDALARRLVVGKHQPREDDDLSGWGRTALPVAVDLML